MCPNIKRSFTGRRLLPLSKKLKRPGMQLKIDPVSICPPVLEQNDSSPVLDSPQSQDECILDHRDNLQASCVPDFISGDVTEFEEGVEGLCRWFCLLNQTIPDKICNELLHHPKKNIEFLPTFLGKFNCLKQVKSYLLEKAEEKILKSGFKKYMYKCKKNDSTQVIYKRNPVNALCDQVRSSYSNDIGISPCERGFFSHPLNAAIGLSAIPLVEKAVKSSSDPEVLWETAKCDGTQSMVGCLQVYSDKSVTSLTSHSFVFYPLHLTLINFSEERRRSLIGNGSTVVAYLPVTTNSSANFSLQQREGMMKKKVLDKVNRLLALHETVEFCLEEVSKLAEVGVVCETRDKCRVRMHFLLASYVSDIPEAEDLLGLKRGNQTPSPCYQCLVRKESMAESSFAKSRSLMHTRRLIERLGTSENRETLEELATLSMHPILPVFADFPFVGIHESVDIYSIFDYDPMHVLSLGISRLLKECLWELLDDSNRKTSALRTSNGSKKTYKAAKRFVLQSMNHFLLETIESSPGFQMRVNLNKEKGIGRLNGLFLENGLAGLLQASDFDRIDKVSPFLGAMADSFCGNSRKAEITKVYTRYVDLLHFATRNHFVPGWSASDIATLRTMIREFKIVGKQVFGKYQASGLCTQKWHALDHIPEAIMRTGGMEYVHTGVYEAAHKSFKKMYRLSSRRPSSLMDEIARKCNLSYITKPFEPSSLRENGRGLSESQLQAAKKDAAYLVRSGPKVTLSDLELSFLAMHEQKNNGSTKMETESTAAVLLKELGYSASLVLIKLMKEHFLERYSDFLSARNIGIQLPMSAYVSGLPTPSLSNHQLGDALLMKDDGRRFLQRVMATKSYYGSETERFDSVIVSCDKKETRSPKTPSLNENDRTVSVWFGKIICFLRVRKPSKESKECDRHQRRSCPACDNDTSKEICFLQWYELISTDMLPLDDFDKTLNCIRLRWQRNEGIVDKLQPSKEYGLVPVESIRGVVHVVRKDPFLSSLCTGDPRRRACEKLLGDSEDWLSEQFFVNRFMTYEVEELFVEGKRTH